MNNLWKSMDDFFNYLSENLQFSKPPIQYKTKEVQYKVKQTDYPKNNRVGENEYEYKKKSEGIAFLLWIFLFPFSPHRIYLGDTFALVIIFLGPFTFFIWPFLDVFSIPRLVREYNIKIDVKNTQIKRIKREIKEKEILRKSGIYEIDMMDGFRFERYLTELYTDLGYIAKITQSQGDFGADIILRTENKTIAVQSKRYKSNVGVSAVQEVSSARHYYSTDESWVVTNSHFTNSAKELAYRSNVKLIDRNILVSQIQQSKDK